jgi:hypothetical protein
MFRIEGYKVNRLDRIGKTGAAICAYIRANIKAKVLKYLTRTLLSGLHQLWKYRTRKCDLS